MKTFSLTEFRRDPLRVLRAASTGASVAVTRRGQVVFESIPQQPKKTLSAFDLIGTVTATRRVSNADLKRGVEDGYRDRWLTKN